MRVINNTCFLQEMKSANCNFSTSCSSQCGVTHSEKRISVLFCTPELKDTHESLWLTNEREYTTLLNHWALTITTHSHGIDGTSILDPQRLFSCAIWENYDKILPFVNSMSISLAQRMVIKIVTERRNYRQFLGCWVYSPGVGWGAQKFRTAKEQSCSSFKSRKKIVE